MTYNKAGIGYKKPKVTLLHATPLVNAEIAGRTAYQSFDKSEHEQVQNFNGSIVEDIEHSDLMDSLAWVHHHHSVLEHINLTFSIKGISRAVLQEAMRHRLTSPTVQSTRYTMSSIIHAYIASILDESNRLDTFTKLVKDLDIFVVDGKAEELEIQQLWEKLTYQYNILKSEMVRISLSKDNLEYIEHCTAEDLPEEVFRNLEAGKAKRNVGDHFKWCVTDNWKVDYVWTMNLRELGAILKLRDSNAAYFQIQYLAKAIKNAIPDKYLNLIVKRK